MKWDEKENRRLAVIATLARDMQNQLGRTALMKVCCYLLQTVKGVPLEYNFSLYSYGPFDSNVLSDLDIAESMGTVISEFVPSSHGYSYSIKSGAKIDEVLSRGQDFIDDHKEDINWVIREFGNCSAGSLELISTIVFVNSEAKSSRKDLIDRVAWVKPRFIKEAIAKRVDELAEKGLIETIQ